jgi:hypothetical protein
MGCQPQKAWLEELVQDENVLRRMTFRYGWVEEFDFFDLSNEIGC